MEKENKNWQDVLREKYAPQIEAWKKQYGTVKAFFIEDSDNSGRVVFFKIPTRQQLSASESLGFDAATGSHDLYKKSERLIVDCMIGGDIEVQAILNDTPLFLSTGNFVLYNLVEQKKTNWETC